MELCLAATLLLVVEVSSRQAPRHPFAAQYHIQTDHGEGRFFRFQTHSGQFRKETLNPDGSQEGSYGWVDPNGVLRLFYYVADSKGYRIVKEKLIQLGHEQGQHIPDHDQHVPHTQGSINNYVEEESISLLRQPAKRRRIIIGSAAKSVPVRPQRRKDDDIVIGHGGEQFQQAKQPLDLSGIVIGLSGEGTPAMNPAKPGQMSARLPAPPSARSATNTDIVIGTASASSSLARPVIVVGKTPDSSAAARSSTRPGIVIGKTPLRSAPSSATGATGPLPAGHGIVIGSSRGRRGGPTRN